MMSSTEHTHKYRGQSLVHGHPGGRVPHGYYGHAEDFEPGSLEPGETYISPDGAEVQRNIKAGLRVLDSDRVQCHLSPDAVLVIDKSHCIVICTPERRITVGDVARWSGQLEAARTEVAVLESKELGTGE